jgi:acetyl esterase/lipase/ferredoxin
MINVTFVTNNGKVVSAPENSNLLRISLREKGGIPYKCGAGLCGTCKCRIERGLEHADPVKEKERKHLSSEDFANGYRMACQTFVSGDVSVSWQPKSNAKPSVAVVGAVPAAAVSAKTAGAFSALEQDARRRMLEIGPVWAEDIVAHRNMVIDAYTPVLAQVPRDGIEVSRELAYGPHERHRLDVYRQEGLADAPVVLFVHGGAFVRGTKDSSAEIYGNFTRYFARNGCVGINMEYRLAPEAAYPGGAEDVAGAIEWIKENVWEYGGNPDRIVLAGHSAGASHAAAYVCDPAVRPSAGPGVAGLVLISGRLRADARADNPNAHGVRAYYGADESLYESRSVVTYAECVDVPLFLAIAEYENPYLDAYAAEFMHRIGMAKKCVPRFVQLRGHNHTSIVAHFDSGEDSLGRELLDFIESSFHLADAR